MQAIDEKRQQLFLHSLPFFKKLKILFTTFVFAGDTDSDPSDVRLENKNNKTIEVRGGLKVRGRWNEAEVVSQSDKGEYKIKKNKRER